MTIIGTFSTIVGVWGLAKIQPISGKLLAKIRPIFDKLMDRPIARNTSDFCQKWLAKIWPISDSFARKFWDPPGSYDLGGKKFRPKIFAQKTPIPYYYSYQYHFPFSMNKNYHHIFQQVLDYQV